MPAHSWQDITGFTVTSWPMATSSTSGPELVDPADGLVTHHLARMAAAVFPGVAVEVRAADAGGDHVDDYLSRPGPRIGPFLNRDVVELAQYERSHGAYLCRPVHPPRRLSLFVGHVSGVDLIQATSLDLVGLLEERGRGKQHCGKDGPDGQGVQARIPAHRLFEVVALNRRQEPAKVAQ